MPLYEYKCERCRKTFEVIQKFSDDPLTVHENCGGHVERLLSAPALQFKGTGWYITDYARNNTSAATNGKPDAKDGKKESKTGTKSETKSESKPSTPASDK
jgi:putative FmdB family regulatory protein